MRHMLDRNEVPKKLRCRRHAEWARDWEGNLEGIADDYHTAYLGDKRRLVIRKVTGMTNE